MNKTVLNYGLYAGIFVSVWMAVAMLVIGCDHGSLGMIIMYTGMLLAFSFIYVAIKNYRDNINGGTIKFGKAFLIGLFITLIASAMYVVAWAIVYHNFLPDFMEKYAAMEIQKAKASGISANEIKAMTDEMSLWSERYKQPFWFITLTLAEIFPVGLLVSLITPLFLHRNGLKAKEV